MKKNNLDRKEKKNFLAIAPIIIALLFLVAGTSYSVYAATNISGVQNISASGKLYVADAALLAVTGGNVGIGTASSNEKLYVIGNIKHTGSMISQGATYSSTWMQFNEDVNGNSLILGAGGLTALGAGESASQVKANVAASTETLYLSSDNDIRFETNLQSGWASRVDAMTISSAGNVGIGTITPDYTLDVVGTIQHREDASWNTGGSPTVKWIGEDGVKISRSGSGYVTATPNIIHKDFRAKVSWNTTTSSHFGLVFHAQKNEPHNNDYAVIIRNNDNVRVQERDSSTQTYKIAETPTGINTDDGNYHTLSVELIGQYITIDIDGTNIISGSIGDNTFTEGMVGLTIYDGTVDFNQFEVQEIAEKSLAKELLVLEGNVGIGTNSPLAKLSVNGNLSLQSGATINEFSIDGTFAGNSDLAVPTEKATKTYVDSVAGSGLTGSGTVNNITKWTGTTSLGSSLLYDSGTGIGIGTNSPNEKLEVTGNIRGTATGAGNTWGVYLKSHTGTAVSKWEVAGSETNHAVTFGAVSNNPLYLITAGSTRITIMNTGEVGIGTTNPGAYKLYVSGNVYTPNGIRADTGIASGAYTLTAGEVRAGLFRDGNSGYYGDFANTGTSMLTAGNVGIGTTSAGYKLDVNGDTRLYGFTNGIAAGANLIPITADAWRTSTGMWTLFTGSTSTISVVDPPAGSSPIPTGKAHQFVSASGSWYLVNQYIPINVNSTYYGRIWAARTSGSGGLYAGYCAYDKDLVRLNGNGGTCGYFINSGSAPSATGTWYYGKISGEGTASTTFPVGTRYIKPLIIMNYDVGGTMEVAGFEISDRPFEQYNGIYDLATRGTSRIYINNNGYVGIGTATPGATLDVEGNLILQNGVAVNEFSIDGTLAGNSDLAVPTEKATKTYVDAHAGSGLTGSGTTNNLTKWTGTSSLGTSLLYDSGTGIGIGTTAPSTNLHVVGDGYFTSELGVNVAPSSKITAYGAEVRASGASAQIFFGRDTGTANSGAIGADGTNVFAVWKPSDFSRPFVITQTGNVGIGTVTPSTKLDVYGNMTVEGGSKTRIYMGGGSGDDFGLGYSSAYPDYGIFYKEGSPDIVALSPNGGGTTNPVLIVTGDSKVGIGTANPGAYTLYANGNTYINGRLTLANDQDIFGVDQIVGYNDLRFYADNAGTTELMRLSGTGGLSLGNAYVTTNPGAGNMIMTGSLGIGTTSSASKLDVIGNINATSFSGDGTNIVNVGRNVVNFAESGSSNGQWVKIATLDFNGVTYHELEVSYRVTSKWGYADYNVRMAVSTPANTFYSPYIYKVDSVGSSVPELELYEIDGQGQYELYLKWNSNYVQTAVTELGFSKKQPDDIARLTYYNTWSPTYIASIPVGRTQVTAVNYFTLNGGNVGIGTASPGAKLDVEGNLILQNGVAINEFSIDGTFAGNSDLAVPTEKATKTYVDAHAGSGLTGSGTTNNLTKWTGTSSLGTSLLYDSGTGIGIGTSTPAGSLELHSVSRGSWNDGLIIEDASGWAATVYRRGATAKMFTGLYSGNDNFIWMAPAYSNTGTTISAPRTDAVLLVRPATDDLQIFLNTSFGGSVGIGTTAPGAKMEIYSTASRTVKVEPGNAIDVSGSPQLTIREFVPGIKYEDASGGAASWMTFANGNNYYITKYTGSPMSSSSTFVIDTNGNVGIGTTSPTGKLDVRGDEVRIWTGAGTDTYATNAGELYVEGDLEVDGTIYGSVSGTLIDPNTGGDNLLRNGDFESSIDNWDASVGQIVTTDPKSGGYHFSVSGVSWRTSSDYIPIDTNKTYKLEAWIKQPIDGGTFYLGTRCFDKDKNPVSAHPGSYDYWAASGANIGSDWQHITGYRSGEDATTSNYYAFHPGTKYCRVLFGVNYGGAGTSYIDDVKLTEVGYGRERVMVGETNDGESDGNIIFASGSGSSETTQTLTLGLQDTNPQLTSSTGEIGLLGNVGVSTNNPAYNLDVNGNARIVTSLGVGTTPSGSAGRLDTSSHILAGGNVYAAGAQGFVYGAGIGEGEYIYRSGNDIRILAGGSDRLTVDGDAGYVGIGTTAPNTALQVYNDNTISGGLTIGTGAAADGGNLRLLSSTNHWNLDNSAGTLRFFTETGYGTGGSVKAVIDSSGNVGIGTANPGAYKLYVNGNIYTPNGLRADTGIASGAYTLTAGEVRAGLFRDGNSGYYGDFANTGTSILTAGKIGIGTASAGETLTINGRTDFLNHELTGAVIWPNVYDQSSGRSVRNVVLNSDDLLSYAVERGYSVTASRGPDSGSLTQMFRPERGSYPSWNGVISTNSVIINISGLPNLAVDRLLIVPGSRNNLPINYTVRTYDIYNGWVVRKTATDESTPYMKLISLSLQEGVQQIIIEVTGAGDADQAGRLSIANIVLTSRYQSGRFTGYGLSAGGDTMYGNLDMNTYLIQNIGNAGTDFTAGGGLNLAGNLAITGTGTNTLAGNSNFDSGTLYVDASANRVGIGTATAGATLDVEGNMQLQSGTAINEFSTDTTLAGNSDLAVPTEKATKTYVDTHVGSALTGSGTTNNLTKWTGTTSLGSSLLYDNGNNMGIGTATPGYKLDVYGTGHFANGITLDSAAYREHIRISRSGNGYYLTQSGTSGYLEAYGSTTQFRIFDPALVVTTGGLVGVNMAPTYNLDVNGNARFSAWISAGGATPGSNGGTSGYGITLPSTVNDFVRIIGEHNGADTSNGVFLTGDNTGDGWIFRETDCCGAGTLDYLTISRGSAGGIGFSWVGESDFSVDSGTLFVESNENQVGIGTTSPAVTLDVNGDIKGNSIILGSAVAGNYDYAKYDDGGIAGINSAGVFSFHADQALGGAVGSPTAGISVAGLYSSGNVGIGETSPSSKLHVLNSGSTLTLEKSASGYFNSFGFNGNNPYITYYSANGLTIGYGSSTGNAPSVNTLFLSNAGSVGIGTTSAGAKLDVRGGSGTATSIYTDGYVEDVSGIVQGNYISSHSWVVGGTGSVGIFGQNGATSENEREWGVGPGDNEAILWKGGNDVASDGDGGWDTNTFPIDHTKTYRVSVWVQKTGSNDGTTYLGISGSQITDLVGTPQGNPYFYCGDLPSLNKWYLMIGYIHGSGDTSTTAYGGIYDGETGKKVQSFGTSGNCNTEFKFTTSATTQQQRAYLYYDTTITDRQYWWDPRFEEVNGKEPTIEALLGIGKHATQNNNAYFGGSVGIGTDVPSSTLDVRGTAQLLSGAAINEFSTDTTLAGNSDLAVPTEKATKTYVDAHAGSGLTGSGTTNNLTKWTGTTSLGTSLLYDSGTGIGIGTASPGAKLDIYGNQYISNSGVLTFTTSAGYNAINMNNNNLINANTITINDDGSGEGLSWGSGRQISVYTVAQGGYNAFVFDTGAAYPFVFNTGSVGIGTTSPANLLSIQQTAAVGGTTVAAVNWKNPSYNLGYLGAEDSTYNSGAIYVYKDGAANTKISGNGYSYLMGGNVGIGTTVPGYPLDVNGNGRVRNNLYVGTGGGYFYADSGSRIAVPNDFYVQSSSGNTYLYSTNTYLGNDATDSIRFRSSETFGDYWRINNNNGAYHSGDSTEYAYNRFGSGGTANYMADSADVYVQHDLEVDGTIYGNILGTTYEDSITVNPTSGVGWYRIGSVGGNAGGTAYVYASIDNRIQRLEFDYNIRSYVGDDNTVGSITVLRSMNYNGGPISQIRIGANSTAGDYNTFLDIYINSATIPVAFTVYGINGANFLSSPTYAPPTPVYSKTVDLSVTSYRGLYTTDSLVVDTNTLFVDAVNDKVGIGTASPGAYKLYVNGNQYVNTDLVVDGGDITNGNVNLDLGEAYTTGALFSETTDNSYYDIYCADSGGNDLCEFKTGMYNNGGTFYNQNNLVQRGIISNDGAAYLQINGGTSGYTYFNGNVGIGTISPYSRLEIQSQSATTGLSFFTSTYDTAKTWGTRIYKSDIGGGIPLLIDTQSSGTWYSSAFFDHGQSDSHPSLRTYYATQLAVTSGNVGIGTTAPTATSKLHISGGDNSMVYFGPNAGWSGYLWVGAGTNRIAASTAQVISTNGNLHLDSGTGNDIYMNYYASRPTRIHSGSGILTAYFDTTGRTALGSSTAYGGLGDLTVNGGDIYLVDTNTRLSEGGGNSLRVTTDSGYIELGPQNPSWAHIQTNMPRYYMNVGITVDSGLIGSYNEDLSLQTSGTTRITALNSNGYVGIGTASPGEKLEVNGNLKLTGSYGATLSTGIYPFKMYWAYSDDGSGYGPAWIHTNTASGNTYPTMWLQTSGDSVTANIDSRIALGDMTLASLGAYPSMTTRIYLNGDSGANSYFNTGGNLGIGTTSPTAKLNIYGTMSTGLETGVMLTNTAGKSWLIHSGIQGVNHNYLGISDYTDAGSTAPYLVITNGGNVGIGTTSPGSKLEVAGTGVSAKLQLFDTDISGASWGKTQFYQDSGVLYIKGVLANEGGTGSIADFGPASNINLYRDVTISGKILQVTGTGNSYFSGNVGIGTTSPLAKVTIQKDETATSTYGTGTALMFNGNAGAGNPWEIYRDNGVTGDLVFSEAKIGIRSNAMRIQLTTGNVGIGTTSPRLKLDVDGPILTEGGTYVSTDTVNDASLITQLGDYIYTETSAGNLRRIIGFDTSYNLDIGQTGTALVGSINLKSGNAGYISLIPGGGEAVRVTSAGNVGIGTTSPTGKLDVRGDEVRIWTGAGTDTYATNSGELYVEGDLEVDGNLYVAGQVHEVGQCELIDTKYLFGGPNGELPYRKTMSIINTYYQFAYQYGMLSYGMPAAQSGSTRQYKLYMDWVDNIQNGGGSPTCTPTDCNVYVKITRSDGVTLITEQSMGNTWGGDWGYRDGYSSYFTSSDTSHVNMYVAVKGSGAFNSNPYVTLRQLSLKIYDCW